MKMKTFLITIVAVFSFLLLRSQPPTESQSFSDEVFDLLTELKGIDNEKYKTNFVTSEELTAFSEKQDLKDEYQSMFDDIQSGKYHKEIEKYYMKIKYCAAKKGVDWEKIQFLDFIYTTYSGGLKGTLFFNHNGKTYSVKVGAYLLDSGYRLSSLKKFKYYKEKCFF